MADLSIWGCAEDGTYSTTGPAVNLSGTIPSEPAIGQLFDTVLDSTETATITIRKDQTNWAIYSGAVFTSGTPDSFSLAAATLEDSEGTLSNSDAVEVFGLAPANSSGMPFFRATESSTGGSTTMGTETPALFDTTDSDTNTDYFSFTSESVLEILVTGPVVVGWNVELESNLTTTRAFPEVYLEADTGSGYVEVSGTRHSAYGRDISDQVAAHTGATIYNATAGDKLRLEFGDCILTNSDTVTQRSGTNSFWAIHMTGIPGAKGETGATGAAGTSGTDGVTMSDYGEEAYNLGTSLTGNVTMDIDDGMVQYGTCTGSTTWLDPTNTTGHAATSILLVLNTGSQTQTWTLVDYWGGSVPTISSGTHLIAFHLVNGNWYGVHLGEATT